MNKVKDKMQTERKFFMMQIIDKGSVFIQIACLQFDNRMTNNTIKT